MSSKIWVSVQLIYLIETKFFIYSSSVTSLAESKTSWCILRYVVDILQINIEWKKTPPPGEYAELLSTLIIRTLLHKFQDVHGSMEVAAGQADAYCCFMFVPSQHPYFDPC